MKNKNEANKRLKLNSLDWFIISILVICIFSIALRAFLIKKSQMEHNLSNEYIVQFEVDGVRSSSLDYFVVGDTVVLKSDRKLIGVIEEIFDHTLSVGAYTENGEVFYPQEDEAFQYDKTRYTVTGTIVAKGEMTDKGFLLDSGIYLSPNGEITVTSEHIETTIKIIKISLK